MADIKEWFKGISFFLVATLLFYFFWDNIFLNIIEFLGTDIFGIGAEATTSLTILKAIGWVSFIFLWITTVPAYLIFAMIAGARNEVKTRPLKLLQGIGVWAVMNPVLSFIYGLIHFLVSILNSADIIETSMETTATQISWVLGIIILLGMTLIPFYFIIQGYGFDIGGNKGGRK